MNNYYNIYNININPLICPISRYTISGNIYIFLCVFESLVSDSWGGALYLSRTSTNLLIEETSFIYCSASGGGAFYFDGSLSLTSVFNKICGYKCSSTTYYYNFGVSYSNYNVKNEFYLLSISNTFSSNTQSFNYMFYITMGYAKLQNSNSSYNLGKNNCGITMYAQQSTTASYNTISNNNNTDGYCIYFYDCTSNGYFNYFNIIENKCINNGIIHSTTKILEISNTIFDKNIGNLFIATSQIKIFNSQISHLNLQTNNVLLFNSTLNIIKYNELTHFSTNKCETFHFKTNKKINYQKKIILLFLLILK